MLDYLKGIVNFCGIVLLVIDLCSCLGMLCSEMLECQCIVVFIKDKQCIGFIVDGVVEVKIVVRQIIEEVFFFFEM